MPCDRINGIYAAWGWPTLSSHNPTRLIHSSYSNIFFVTLRKMKTSSNPALVCLFASAAAGSVLWTSTCPPASLTRLRTLLDAEQRRRLDAIAAERRDLAVLGLLVGTLLALVIARGSLCASVLTVIVAQHLIYLSAPKSDWLLLHLRSEEQRRAWLDVYVDMRTRGHVGAALGLLAYAAVVWGMTKR